MAEEVYMLSELEQGTFEVAIFEGKVLLSVSSETVSTSCVLSGEEARKLSSYLLTAYVELLRFATSN